MVIVTGWLRFNSEDRDDVLAGMQEVTNLSRQDPGCIDYWWAEALGEPNTFRFFECWESEELFRSHRAQPFEDEFMTRYVSRVVDAGAHTYDADHRRSATG